jgi:hypothetical protein
MVVTEVVLRVIMVEVVAAVVPGATPLQVVTEEVQTTLADRQLEVAAVAAEVVFLIHSTDKVALVVVAAELAYLELDPMVQDQ